MSEQERKVEGRREVRIHIDQERYESPNPTTGEALYLLCRITAGEIIYREVSGDREDVAIENGPGTIHLKEDEHFHSGQPKAYRIHVNGQEKTVTNKILTFDEIVALAFPTPPTGENILFAVDYEDGPHQNPNGSLVAGGEVRIKNRMIFNVTPTDKS